MRRLQLLAATAWLSFMLATKSVSGEVDPFNKLFVAAGYEINGKVNLVDLEVANSVCDEIPHLPYDSVYASAFGALVVDRPGQDDGEPLLCGGTSYDSTHFSDCFQYDVAEREWLSSPFTLPEPRAFTAVAPLNGNQWWITGGSLSVQEQWTDTTLIFTPGEGFSPFVRLPLKDKNHCLVQINSTHYFLLAGTPNGGETFIFDLETTTFHEQEVHPQGKRFESSCSLSGRDDIVVTAGRNSDAIGDSTYVNTTYVFSLSTGAWRPGVAFPLRVGHAEAVPYHESGSFLVVGGYDPAEPERKSNKIFQYRPETDEGGAARWELMEQRLNDGYSAFSAFLVPDTLFKCNATV